jgi:hypothetical protein
MLTSLGVVAGALQPAKLRLGTDGRQVLGIQLGIQRGGPAWDGILYLPGQHRPRPHQGHEGRDRHERQHRNRGRDRRHGHGHCRGHWDLRKAGDQQAAAPGGGQPPRRRRSRTIGAGVPNTLHVTELRGVDRVRKR